MDARTSKHRKIKGLSYEKVQKIYAKKGYKFFDKGQYNLNIFGIRCATDTNLFDDYLCVAYRDKNNKEHVLVWEATTDPGRHWLNNPMNKKGTAIVVPGQYPGSHKIGKHQGKYVALRQKGLIKVYRDDDRDNEHDLDPNTIDEGRKFGINIHRSNPNDESTIVNKWSAGCQVFSKVKDFNIFMWLCKLAAKRYSNSFTYTLLEDKDVL